MGKLSFFVLTVLLMMVFIITFPNSSLSQDAVVLNVAKNILNNKTLSLPSNVRNFIILIPNEAHESPLLPKEQRLINQPYVPQNLVISPNVNIVWFSGDVGHTRKVTLADQNSRNIFDSSLKFNSASDPVSLNETGKFTYYENDANNQDPDFVMNGTITVTNSVAYSNNTHNNISKLSFDTLSSIIVPTKDIEKHSEMLDENNISIVNQYSFKELRENGGANQTLLVIGSDNPIDEIISVLKKITSTLPYG
jgi:hypothetical protein